MAKNNQKSEKVKLFFYKIMENTNYYSDQEKDIRENDRDRDRGEGDRQDINLKKESVVVQYWNVFIPPLDVEEVVQGTVFLLMINYIKMYISFHYFRSYFENHMKSIKFVFEIGLPFKIT